MREPKKFGCCAEHHISQRTSSVPFLKFWRWATTWHLAGSHHRWHSTTATATTTTWTTHAIKGRSRLVNDRGITTTAAKTSNWLRCRLFMATAATVAHHAVLVMMTFFFLFMRVGLRLCFSLRLRFRLGISFCLRFGLGKTFAAKLWPNVEFLRLKVCLGP